MNLKLKRTPGIYLVGFMGSGKTTLGRMFAEEIGWRFADLDDDIETAQGASITDLFGRLGEPEFRRIETEAMWRRIHEVRRGIPTVLALGGGAFTREENIEALTENGITVWIDTEFATMKARVESATHRPLAKDPERFETLYRHRKPFYRRAEFHVHLRSNDRGAALRSLLDLHLLD